jgi:hypothetical protein
VAHLFLNLLFLVHILGDFGGFSKLLCGFGFHIQTELGGGIRNAYADRGLGKDDVPLPVEQTSIL